MSEQKYTRPEWHKIEFEKDVPLHGKKILKAFKLKWNFKITNQALCKGLDTELFYPDKNIFTPSEEKVFASMCVECPVMLMCLEWGLAHERFGIWGGLTPSRRAIERTKRGWVAIDPQTGMRYDKMRE